MEQAVTYDELVAFAAKKVGGEPYLLNMSDVMVRIDGKALPLSSWDLMGKGLAVLERLGGMFLLNTKEKLLTVQVRAPQWALRHFDASTELPLAFWTAWHALEPDQQTQEPT